MIEENKNAITSPSHKISEQPLIQQFFVKVVGWVKQQITPPIPIQIAEDHPPPKEKRKLIELDVEPPIVPEDPPVQYTHSFH